MFVFRGSGLDAVKDNPERRRAVFIFAAGVHRLKKIGIVVQESATKKWPPLGRFYCSVTLLVGPENGHTFRAQETHKKQEKVSCRGYTRDEHV